MTNAVESHAAGGAGQRLALRRPAEDGLTVVLAGRWCLDETLPSHEAVECELSAALRRLTFDTAALGDWDSGLLTFLSGVLKACAARGIAVDQDGLTEGVRRLLAMARRSPGWRRIRLKNTSIESITECLEYKPEVTLTLEPINRYETNLYNDTRSAMEVIDKIDRPNLKMLADTFHMNIEERDIIESILHAKGYISHVHFADSNRWAPGYGHIDFSEILDALEEIGYQGAVSAEILPKPTPEECLKLTITYYQKLGL